VPLLKSGLRRDLCERLGEGHLWKVPTLDERGEDIPGLIKVFLKELRLQSSIDARFSEAAVRACTEASWPGQIRELRAAVRALVQAAHARAVTRGSRSPPAGHHRARP
jgi:DNA-binding NtrC family response regulator